MKNLAFLLVFTASLTFAQQAAKPARPAPAKSACVPLLQAQMQDDTTAALTWKSSAYTDGLIRGAFFGAGGMLLIIAVVSEIRKIKQPSGAQKSISRAASA
jgi:hypothetical protein